eukprot:CAMPEP_0178970166 /NCGR_PEP_ID=MMETSP0789-20121207/19350_1 /TAXON_ID=3005 /ORGANISM="Rhizosolenia setigera, Strain CCMP 1694" /LENGTH=161 /DNA_ID=CAMNT_0020656559 /DNA_START=258 /DNA_END=743 /DNA_ORIENTATION=+
MTKEKGNKQQETSSSLEKNKSWFKNQSKKTTLSREHKKKSRPHNKAAESPSPEPRPRITQAKNHHLWASRSMSCTTTNSTCNKLIPSKEQQKYALSTRQQEKHEKKERGEVGDDEGGGNSRAKNNTIEKNPEKKKSATSYRIRNQLDDFIHSAFSPKARAR